MLDDILNAPNLTGCERRNYKDHIADCPVCGGVRRVLIRADSDGRVHVGCVRRCYLGHILRCWNLDYSVLFPAGKPARPEERGWWHCLPRYANGPVRPMPEQ